LVCATGTDVQLVQLSAENAPLPQSRSAAALAFYDLVALLEQALALAIPALLLLLDVGAFFVGHEQLQALMHDAIRSTAIASIIDAGDPHRVIPVDMHRALLV